MNARNLITKVHIINRNMAWNIPSIWYFPSSLMSEQWMISLFSGQDWFQEDHLGQTELKVFFFFFYKVIFVCIFWFLRRMNVYFSSFYLKQDVSVLVKRGLLACSVFDQTKFTIHQNIYNLQFKESFTES